MIKCLIISYNRPTFLKKQLEYLLNHKDLEVIIIDNNSTNVDLIDYYKTLPCKVHKMGTNYGHDVVWSQGLSKYFCGDESYIVTDPDIILDHVKSDWLEVLKNGLSLNDKYKKVGLGLNTNQIPYNAKRRDEIIRHETKYIERKEIGHPIYYECPVDTTLALYRGGNHTYGIWDSLRCKKPYEATHLGWHISVLDEELKQYFESSLQTTGHWKIQ